MLNFTKHNLKKIEELFEEIGYQVRYEKGNFQSGYCMVEARKIVVINKFYDTEARINVLLDIIFKLDLLDVELSEKNAKFLKQLKKIEA